MSDNLKYYMIGGSCLTFGLLFGLGVQNNAANGNAITPEDYEEVASDNSQIEESIDTSEEDYLENIVQDALDAVDQGIIDAEATTSTPHQPDALEEAFFKQASWNSDKLFESLTKENIYKFYNFFRSTSAARATSEWACKTGNYNKVNDEVFKLAETLYDKQTQNLIVTLYREELELHGYGNPYVKCNSDFLSNWRSSYKEKITTINLLTNNAKSGDAR